MSRRGIGRLFSANMLMPSWTLPKQKIAGSYHNTDKDKCMFDSGAEPSGTLSSDFLASYFRRRRED